MTEQALNTPDTEDGDADWEDPWFRKETRVPAAGPPWPDWVRDPLTPQLLDAARELLGWVMRGVWGPASYALQEWIWQWKKFELLDWLRPLELLLRRMLLIEAFALAGSQSLPPARPGRAGVGPRSPAPEPECDPAKPETWRVSFIALPGQPRSGPHRKHPPVQPDRLLGEPVFARRYRRKLHPSLPLARRLEAAIRVINNPLPFVRRLAFRLRRGRTPGVTRLIIPGRQKNRLARDALVASGDRAVQLANAFWSSA